MPAILPSSPLVLVEIKNASDVDKGVIPAVVEYIVGNNIVSRTRTVDILNNVAVLCVDHPASLYGRACSRGAVPQGNVIDGYSQWYGAWSPGTGSFAEQNGTRPKVHIGSFTEPHQLSVRIAEPLYLALAKSRVRRPGEHIAVIDSLSSILSLSPQLETFLGIQDALHRLITKERNDTNLVPTLVAIIHTAGVDSVLANSLERLANTHIQVLQTSARDRAISDRDSNEVRDYVILKVRRRKASGRVYFEELVGRMNWDELRICDVEGRSDTYPGRAGEKERLAMEDELREKLTAHGLSFRVTLSSREREVRAAAGLPFLHHDESLADSALSLHPENLRVQDSGERGSEGDELSSHSSCDKSDDEDMFSEDV